MAHVERLQPIIVADLLPEILDALIELLSGLSAEEWEKPTACTGWSVRNVAAHLLGDEIGNLSRRRDGYSAVSKSIESWGALSSTSATRWASPVLRNHGI